MKLFKPQDLEDSGGDIILLYGETGVGKSVSVIQSAEEPIFYFLTEPRQPAKFLQAANRPNVDIDFSFYENWEDMMDFFSDPGNFTRYKTIVIDSLSFLSNVNLSEELSVEAFDARTVKEKNEKPLTSRTKLNIESYGAMAGQMMRFTNLVSKFSQLGKTVILIALLENNPKFNRDLTGGPSLTGKSYPKSLPGFCDFIALIEPRIDEKTGLTKFPPLAIFNSENSFMSKWTGYPGPGRGPLDIQKILAKAHGRE